MSTKQRSNVTVSRIHLDSNTLAAVFPLDGGLFQGGLFKNVLNAPAGYSLHRVSKSGQLSTDLAGMSINMDIFQKWLSRHDSLLVVRTTPVKFPIHIRRSGAFNQNLGVKDGYELDVEVYGCVTQPLVLAESFDLLHPGMRLTVDAVSAALADSLKLAISESGQSILFKNGRTIQDSLRSISDTVGIHCTRFVLDGFESDLNQRGEEEARRIQEMIRRLEEEDVRLPMELSRQISEIIREGVKASAPMDDIMQAVNALKNSYWDAKCQLQRARQEYCPLALTPGEQLNAPRQLQHTRNAGNPRLNTGHNRPPQSQWNTGNAPRGMNNRPPQSHGHPRIHAGGMDADSWNNHHRSTTNSLNNPIPTTPISRFGK